LATIEFLRALGYGEQLFSGELDFQLVKQSVQWKALARFDQVLEISVFAKGLGTTSSPWPLNSALPARTN
jgi:acyl-CoA thioester hydrolase